MPSSAPPRPPPKEGSNHEYRSSQYDSSLHPSSSRPFSTYDYSRSSGGTSIRPVGASLSPSLPPPDRSTSPLSETDPELANALRDSVHIGSATSTSTSGFQSSQQQQQQYQQQQSSTTTRTDMPAAVRAHNGHAHTLSSSDVGLISGSGAPRTQPRSSLANPFEGDGEEEDKKGDQPSRVKFSRAMTR